MTLKIGLLVLTLLAACLAVTEPDLSIFFDHNDNDASIVGGTRAATASHPHMVALTTGMLTIRMLFCGGSLVSKRSILTAAHCVHVAFRGGSLAKSVRAVVGTNLWHSGGEEYKLIQNISHPNYVNTKIKNDISILVTSTNVVMSNDVQPVPLTFDFIGSKVNAIVAGWGTTKAGGSRSPTLLELKLSTIDSSECVSLVAQAAINLNIRAPPVEPDIEICTLHSIGYGTCRGDSGSALRRADNGHQIGIVSWGFPCARGAPDMFARISAYKSWLTENMKRLML